MGRGVGTIIGRWLPSHDLVKGPHFKCIIAEVIFKLIGWYIICRYASLHMALILPLECRTQLIMIIIRLQGSRTPLL